MADNIIDAPATDQGQASVSQEVADMMAISLNGGMAPQPATDAPVSGQPADNSANAGVAPPPADATPVVPDPFGIFKDKFGYQSHEDAIKEIEELRAFKAAPTPELKYENDESKAIAQAIAAGKNTEVWEYLDKQRRIDGLVNADLNDTSAADVVKLGMQLKYKDLTSKEIDYKFNKQFAIPPKPVQDSVESDLEFQERVGTWDMQVADKKMELLIEAKLTKPELVAAKSNLVIPPIGASVDEGYLQYKKMLEQETQMAAEDARADVETKAAYKAFVPKALETKINFNDEANKIAFEFQFEPDAEGFAKAVELACDSDAFWKSFNGPDGKPDRQKFLKTLYYANNIDKVLGEAMKQAKNATIKSMLPDNNGQAGLVRQLVTAPVEESELDKNMRQSLKGYAGY